MHIYGRLLCQLCVSRPHRTTRVLFRASSLILRKIHPLYVHSLDGNQYENRSLKNFPAGMEYCKLFLGRQGYNIPDI